VKLRRKDGEEIWVLISGAPFYDELGNVIGSLGIHYEITDRKNLEANLEIAKEKAVYAQQAEQQFLANMSHEIRTPLNAIIGMSHLLKDSEPNANQIEFIDILSNSASLLKNLVSDILDISKIDAGKVEQYNTSFDLGLLTNKLKQTFSQRAFEKSIQLKLKENYSSIYIFTDQSWLSQILMNLISNAIKFTNEGEIIISINASDVENNKIKLDVEIIDTGIGLSANEIKMIFNEFQQANKSIRKEFGGTGLGLSIASKLVRILGGELNTRSIKGKGSTFYFSLVVDKSIEKATNLLSIHSSNNSFSGVNLLVVEDNLMNQRYISTLLKKWDITFRIAENGREAVNMFSDSYDLVFMDLSMPIMNGYEATKRIRSISMGKDIPIIALTASTFLSKKQLALQSGMTDFLAKPFTPDELKRMIEKHIVIKSLPIQEKTSFTFNEKLNQETLTSLYNGDYVYAFDMFSTFNKIIDDEFVQLKTALKNNNIERIKAISHKIKPMFSMVGIPSITNIFEEIANEKESKEIEFYKAKVENVFYVFNDFREIIKDQIKQLNIYIKNN
jgi:signal transduction histidine kinase/CheY-like chemotaxis protein